MTPVLVLRNLVRKTVGSGFSSFRGPGGSLPGTGAAAELRLWLMAGGAFAAILGLVGLLRLSGSL